MTNDSFSDHGSCEKLSEVITLKNSVDTKYTDGSSENNRQTIDIGGKQFITGFSALHDKELLELKQIVMRERGHFQFVKQGICIFLISCVIFMNLIITKGDSPSIIGIEQCSLEHWLIQLTFILICICVAILAVKMNRREQKIKMKYDVNIS